MKQIVKYIFISVIAFATALNLSAQDKVSVQGKIIDAAHLQETVPSVWTHPCQTSLARQYACMKRRDNLAIIQFHFK